MKDVPLVVPEVNPDGCFEYRPKGIIANPNCTTIMMVVVLKPIEKISHIKKIHISSYQSASAVPELWQWQNCSSNIRKWLRTAS
jgi:aspartate-semialdehyde dehydrogenase